MLHANTLTMKNNTKISTLHSTVLVLLICSYALCNSCSQLLAFENIQWNISQLTGSIVSIDYVSAQTFFGLTVTTSATSQETCENSEWKCPRSNTSCLSKRIRIAPLNSNLFELYTPHLQQDLIEISIENPIFLYPLQLGVAKTAEQYYVLYQVVYEPLVNIECPTNIEYGTCSCVQPLASCNEAIDDCSVLSTDKPLVRPFLPHCTTVCPSSHPITIGWQPCDPHNESMTLEFTTCKRSNAKYYARRICASFSQIQIEESLSLDGKCNEKYLQKNVYLSNVHQGQVCCSYIFDWSSLNVYHNCSHQITNQIYHKK